MFYHMPDGEDSSIMLFHVRYHEPMFLSIMLSDCDSFSIYLLLLNPTRLLFATAVLFSLYLFVCFTSFVV